jgi:hypothetical protein
MRHEKVGERPPNENTNTRHFRFNGSSVARRSSLPKICLLVGKYPTSDCVTSGVHSTYFQYLAEITADSAKVCAVIDFHRDGRALSGNKAAV